MISIIMISRPRKVISHQCLFTLLALGFLKDVVRDKPLFTLAQNKYDTQTVKNEKKNNFIDSIQVFFWGPYRGKLKFLLFCPT